MGRNIHAVPRYMGFILIAVGMIFLVSLLAMIQIWSISELWEQVLEQTGWSPLIIGYVFASLTIVALMIAYGAEIVYYHDKDDPE